jgi:hypothetical protein
MKTIVVCTLVCFDWNAGFVLLYCLFELQLGEVWELEPDRARRSRMATTAREGDIQDVKCDKLPFATCLNLYRDE